MFYLLRDWDQIVSVVDGWLPQRRAQIIRAQVLEINSVLSAFVRGQFTVCVLLGVFYAAGLSLIGLDFGIVIGLVTGIISFVPYFGMLFGFVIGVGVAIASFVEWEPVILVAALFFIGQFLESNFITPKLVGNKIGLHPVWMIISLLAGGAILGFIGVLLSIPLAAVIGVLLRFGIAQYKTSDLYLHRGSDDEAG
jgi:predicted PurR-regulated permease PerM